MLNTSSSFLLQPNGTFTARSQATEGSNLAFFDDVMGLALLISQAPMVVLAFGNEEMHLRTGSGVQAPPPYLYSFCQLAGAGMAHDLTEVADLVKDAHLAQHPAVTNTPSLRFCASIGLLSPSHGQLGTLYLLDTKSRKLTPAQRDGLVMLARHTTMQLGNSQSAADQQVSPKKAGRPSAEAHASAALARPEIFVKHEQRFIRLLNTDIQYVEALGDYVNIYTDSLGRLTQYATMKEMERKLPWTDFARVHRKYIVRLDRIVAIEGDVLHLDINHTGNPNEIAIGSSYKATLLSRLNLI